jgi:hypothetical protein
MPLTQSAVEIRVASSMRARFEHAVGQAFREREHLRRECEDIRAENARLADELERSRDENLALRESAEIWIRMYENQLARANRASELLAQCAGTVSR